METEILPGISTLSADSWNRLTDGSDPFLRHEFLAAMEQNGCVGQTTGWIPRPITAWRGQELVGALPMYLKHHSFGEFVFDWSWADAYARLGLAYYPKLVVAVPYTPVTGKRILVRNGTDEARIAYRLVETALDYTRKIGASSLHWLYPVPADMQTLSGFGLSPRTGLQFHWTNEGYGSFDDFLATLEARKRKQIKRERRRVAEQCLEVQLLSGESIQTRDWYVFHNLYQTTYAAKGGVPWLTKHFFVQLGRSMPQHTLLIQAYNQGKCVAGAFFLRGGDTLFGRYWACTQAFHSLHFELCYYRAIEYCITHGLRRFEAGAQGEHKLARGLLPTLTYSAHWIEHPELRFRIDDFLDRERLATRHRASLLLEHAPYKSAPEASC